MNLCKKEQLSDWNEEYLTDAQCHYAAADAWAPLKGKSTTQVLNYLVITLLVWNALTLSPLFRYLLTSIHPKDNDDELNNTTNL